MFFFSEYVESFYVHSSVLKLHSKKKSSKMTMIRNMMIRNPIIRSSDSRKDFLGVVVDCKVMPSIRPFKKTFHYRFKTLNRSSIQ